MPVRENHIREALARYISGEVTLTQFQEWFIPRAWEVLAQRTGAADLVGDIELLLAEFTSGQSTERELRVALRTHALIPEGGLVLVESVMPWLYRWSSSVAGADLGNSTLEFSPDGHDAVGVA